MESGIGKEKRIRPLRLFVMAVGLIIVTTATALWSQEVWLRPRLLHPVGDFWLGSAVVVGMVAAVFGWPSVGSRNLWWRAGACGLLSAILLGSGRVIRGEVTVRYLVTHEERHLERWEKFRMRELVTDVWAPIRPMLDWLSGHGVWVPSKGKQGDEMPYHVHNFRLERLLETCRWNVRSGFFRSMMADEKNAEFLMRDWNRIFPVVTGQDVTLSNRTEMIEWLDLVAVDEVNVGIIRDAATFWMALVVLTDPESFATWREPVRDRMLASDNPPLHFSGDVWMRVLDLLLAYDSEEVAVVLTESLTRDSDLMRRALRERVRGMEGHMESVMAEIERQNARGATPMWVDLKYLTDRLPDSEIRTQTRARLGSMMVAWLMGDASSLRERFSSRSDHRKLGVEDLVIELSAEQQKHLKIFAFENLQKPYRARSQGSFDARLPTQIEQALMIRHYLRPDDQVALAEHLSLILMDEDWRADVAPDVALLDLARLFGFAGIWGDLSEESRINAGKWLRHHLHVSLDPRDRSFRYFMGALSQYHAIHPYLGFDEADRLALKFCFGSNPFSIRQNTGLWWTLESDVCEPPRYSHSGIEAFLVTLEDAVANEKNSIALDPGENELVFETVQFRLLRKRFPLIPAGDAAIFLLVANNLVPPDGFFTHLTDRPRFFDGQGRDTMWKHAWFEGFPEWYDDVRLVKAAFESWNREDWSGVARLVAHLERDAPNEEVLAFVRSYFRSLAENGPEKWRAYRMLLRIEEHLDGAMRNETRRRFHEEFRWPGASVTAFHLGYDEVALRNRAGLIAWQDDALSSEQGWASHVCGELSFEQVYNSVSPKAIKPTLIFQYLQHAREAAYWSWGVSYYYLDSIVPKSAWLADPPELPFQATPWQQARELYLRRPDLHFPDSAKFR
jgi:hypothetical protein